MQASLPRHPSGIWMGVNDTTKLHLRVPRRATDHMSQEEPRVEHSRTLFEAGKAKNEKHWHQMRPVSRYFSLFFSLSLSLALINTRMKDKSTARPGKGEAHLACKFQNNSICKVTSFSPPLAPHSRLVIKTTSLSFSLSLSLTLSLSFSHTFHLST